MDIKIVNGKLLHSKDYPYDFHTFFHEKTIELFIFLPGIIPESLLLKVNQVEQVNKDDETLQILQIKTTIKREYRQIFKSDTIEMEGKLSAVIRPNIFATEYQDGILKIEFALELKSA